MESSVDNTLTKDNLNEEERSKRDNLVIDNMKLVTFVASKYFISDKANIDFDDLVAMGNVGLVKAANTFDESKNFQFSTYACKCIKNEINRYFQKLDRSLQADISMDESIYTSDDGEEFTLLDAIGTEGDVVYDTLEKDMMTKLLLDMVYDLPPRESLIIELRYDLKGTGKRETLAVIAEKMGVSRTLVSYLEKKSLSKLRKKIEAAE